MSVDADANKRERKDDDDAHTMSFESFSPFWGDECRGDVPLAWTKLARDDRRKEKNDDAGRRRLFENGARLACSPFVFLGGYSARARALQHEDEQRIFGETFLCGKTNVIKAVEKHFEKYNEEYYYYAED